MRVSLPVFALLCLCISSISLATAFQADDVGIAYIFDFPTYIIKIKVILQVSMNSLMPILVSSWVFGNL